LLPLVAAAAQKNFRAVASNSSTFFRPDENAAVVICENDITCLHLDQPVWQKGVTIEAFVLMKMRKSL